VKRVLGIDTAGSRLAVGAWSGDGAVVDVAGRESLEHSRRLVTAVAEVLERAGWSPEQVDLIAVSRGPGSYTGLRLGAMVAKTLGWAVGAPLVGVDSLAVLAANAAGACDAVVAALPARRGRLYARAYRLAAGGEAPGIPAAPAPDALGPLEEGEAVPVLARALAAARAAGGKVLVLGEGIRRLDPAELASALAAGPEGGPASGVPVEPATDVSVQPAPPGMGIPRGSVVARLGLGIARQQGTVPAVDFVPWYVGPDVASPARGGWGIGTGR